MKDRIVYILIIFIFSQTALSQNDFDVYSGQNTLSDSCGNNGITSFDKNPVPLSNNNYNAEIIDKDHFKLLDTLDFGNFCRTADKTIEVIVRNQSESDITLKEPVLSNTEYFSASFTGSKQLIKDASTEMEIRFSASDTSKYEAVLYLYCEEYSGIIDTLHIRANVVITEFEVVYGGEFGNVPVNVTQHDTIKVINNGTAKAFLRPPSNPSPPFTLIDYSPWLPAVLNPGDTMFLYISFKPYKTGEFIDSMLIRSIESINTCTDSLYVKIKGRGIEGELEKDDLDFGSVPYCKVFKGTAYIYNFGSTKVTLKNAQINGTDAGEFQLINKPPDGFVLNPGDTARYDVDFIPGAPYGNKQAQLMVDTDDPDKPVLRIALSALSEEMNLTADDVDLGKIAINRSLTFKAKLKNENGFEVSFSDVKTNEQWIDITPKSGTVPANDLIELDLSINIPDEADYSAIVTFIIDDPCPDAVEFNVDLKGVKSFVKVTPLLYYGETEFCQEKEREIEIINHEEFPVTIELQNLTGSDKSLFELDEDLSGEVIDSGDTLVSGISFTPANSDNGDKSAEVITILDLEGEQIEFVTELKGKRYTIKYVLPDEIDIYVEPGKTKGRVVDLKNTGKHNFTVITMILNQGNKFQLKNDLSGQTITQGTEKQFSVETSTNVYDEYKDTLVVILESDNCTYEHEIFLHAFTEIDIRVWLPDTTADVGTPRFCIPVMAKTIPKVKNYITISYDAEISMNAEIFLPDIQTDIVNEERFVNLSGVNVRISEEDTKIGQICGLVLLAEDDTSPLTIEDFTITDDQQINYEIKKGSLRITGVCEQFLRKVSKLELTTMNVSPLAANERTEINIKTEERGNFSLSLYSVEGARLLRKKWHKGGGNRDYTIPLTLENFSPGVYQFILITPWNVLRERIIIVK